MFGVHTTRGIIQGSECYPIRSVRSAQYKYIRNLQPEPGFRNIVTEQKEGLIHAWLARGGKDAVRAREVARKLESMPVSHGAALGAMLHAQLACLSPGRAEPLALATRALELIEDPASGMLRERERAVWLKGRLLGGSAGEALMDEARRQLAQMGVASPERHLQQGLPALEVV